MSAELFDQLPIFQDLSMDQLDLLRLLFVRCEYQPGMILFEQGDRAYYLYLIITGEVTIRFKPEDGQAITITRVRDGGIVGWSALIGRRAYTSAAICDQITSMFRVCGSELQTLCEQFPETGLLIADRLAALVARRPQVTHQQVKSLLEFSLRNRVYHRLKLTDQKK